MSIFPVGLREVVPNQSVAEKVREFVINTGGTQSTLQDIKLPDSAGGFVYQDRDTIWTRNRSIVWRTSHDVLDLCETSLDWNLSGNRVHFRFQNTPILSGGVSVHENRSRIIILVATVSSVHKMVFRHPRRLHKDDIKAFRLSGGSAQALPSIFDEASTSTPKEHYHVLQLVGASPLPNAAASCLDSEEEAYFALANPVGNITLVKLGNMKGIVSFSSLKSSSYFGRLLGNIGGILSRTPAEGYDTAMSLVVHPILSEMYVFAICKDHKLKMWLASSYECVMVADVLNYASSASNWDASKSVLQQGAQNHVLKKVSDPHQKDGGMALAVFLSFSHQSQFCVLQPARVDGQFQLKHLATVYAPDYDLVDFTVTPSGYLVALWTDPDGLPVLRYTCFGSAGGFLTSYVDEDALQTGWTNVVLEPPLDPDFPSPENAQCDPRQVYLHQLFYPGRFSISTLVKTVGIYRRSMDLAQSLTDDSGVTMTKLREEVCAAVETEIQNQITEFEISDEEHIAISYAAWSKFYSCALQYHEAGAKPLGLICHEASGLISIVKKSGQSFVRPVDALEHLALNDSVHTNVASLFQDIPMLHDEPVLAQDVITLMEAINLVGSVIQPHLAEEYTHALQRLISPDQIARKIVTEVLTEEMDDEGISSIIQELSMRLQQIGDISKALEVLLMSLELDGGIVSHSDILNVDHHDEDSGEEDEDDEDRWSMRLFASNVGVSLIAESLNQMASTRFILTRDLIVLQMIMLQCNLPEGLPPNTSELIHSTYLPRSVVMSHSYFILVWATETTAIPPPPDSLEHGMRQLAVLKISDTSGSCQNAAQQAKILPRPLTLSEMFLMGPGRIVRRLLTRDIKDSPCTWSSILLPLMNISSQLLWPRCALPIFQEFLLMSCQYMHIQDYVRLLSTWCDWNCHSRQFLLGSALLNMGEADKACDWMIQAAAGVNSDRFLLQLLFPKLHESELKRLSILFFLKVIQLFEQFSYYDCIIELAKTALAVCDDADPDRTTLCYILFTNHLKLGHNNEAYDAMIANPDQSRRKDSLRQFIVTLFERRQLKQLAAFPYIDMVDELESVIESRARSIDLTVNNYYEFLYSFHIFKENYRKAAHVMYEFGMRLGTEVFTLDGLKRQAKCLLLCINALKLVNPNYAWIVKPVLHAARASEREEETVQGFKRDSEGMEINELSTKIKIQVLMFRVVFQLVCARLKMAHREKDSNRLIPGPGLSANDILVLLISANLFDYAAKVCELFKLDARPIIDALVSRCVKLTKARSAEQEAAWEWILNNCQAEGKAGNISHYRGGGGAAVDCVWSMLQQFVERLEAKRETVLHNAAATKLFSLGSTLPAWLVTNYKKKNVAQLLRLYLIHGHLEEAANLSIEYIRAVLGDGKEFFGLEHGLNASAPPVWMPHNLFDQLLLELQHNCSNPAYNQLYVDLNETLNQYLIIAARTSTAMLEIRRSS